MASKTPYPEICRTKKQREELAELLKFTGARLGLLENWNVTDKMLSTFLQLAMSRDGPYIHQRPIHYTNKANRKNWHGRIEGYEDGDHIGTFWGLRPREKGVPWRFAWRHLRGVQI
jgi:hypothetical protein